MTDCNHPILRALSPDGRCPVCDVAPDLDALERELAARTLGDLTRARLVRSLDAFAEWGWPLMTGAPLVRNSATQAIIARLQRVADAPHYAHRILIALPPGVGKSTILAVYSAWRLARDPGHRALHIGHASDLAATESRRVRRLVEGDEFRAMFPAVQLRQDENTSTLWATTANGLYLAAGVDSGVLGRRAFEAVLDDPLHGQDRWSTSAKQKLVEWFFGTLTNRLDGAGTIIVCQQRLAKDDLIGCLADIAGWELISLPAEDEHGNLLAPTILTREKLDELREASPSNYACMFLQRPSDDATAAIPRTWWRFHRENHVPESVLPPLGCEQEIPAIPTPDKFDRTVIVMDGTFGGTKKTNDYACIQVWSCKRSPTGKNLLYLRHQWRKRTSQLEQRAALRGIMRSYPEARAPYVEKAAGGAGLIEELIADGIPVEPITPLGSKETRLGLYASAPIEEGRVLLPLGASYVPELVEEMAGGTGHDDSQDCVVYGCKVLGTPTKSVWDAYSVNRTGPASNPRENMAALMAGALGMSGHVRENITPDSLRASRTSDQRKQDRRQQERARRTQESRSLVLLTNLATMNRKPSGDPGESA